ncbi:S8 family serine peptidase [Microcoleus vaginatus GB2-A3]|uniref:S8 family serine peptidase n=1 Tax=Microcoleus vaginatus TaxID=119532 RepID=UPI0032A55CCA
MLDIKTNPNDRLYLNQQPNANAQSIFPANSDLLNGAIEPLNIPGYSAESSLTNLTASSIDRQTQIADFLVGDAGDIFSFSASDRVTGDVADSQLKPQSQSAIANADPLTGMISASQLNFSDPGNSISTARNIVGVENGSISLSDFVGTGDSNDFYRFDINTKSNFNLRLDGLRADADVNLIQDRNRNGIVDSGEYVDYSQESGITPDVINVPNLAPGTYYVQVSSYLNNSTNYNLSLSATPVPVVPDITTPSGPFNSNYGYGLVNANAAVSSTLNRSSLFPALPDLGGTNWALNVINAPEVWNQNITGNGIVVAVVDTGVDYTHPDLDGNIWQNAGEIAGNGIDDDRNGYIDDIRGWDFVSNDNDPRDQIDNNPIGNDFYGHGTHVAGSIAAERNDFGITGVAPNAKIMPVRVLPAFGSGEWNNVAAGIRYAADNGANVINLSILGDELVPSNVVNNAIQYANNKGSVVFMAAGNSGDIQPVYPARNADRLGIAVGSIDVRGRMADSSNRAGSRPLDYLVAPGVEIVSTIPDDDYNVESGTSMATPQVAGVAALVLSANPTLTPAQVEYILTTTANRNGLTG